MHVASAWCSHEFCVSSIRFVFAQLSANCFHLLGSPNVLVIEHYARKCSLRNFLSIWKILSSKQILPFGNHAFLPLRILFQECLLDQFWVSYISTVISSTFARTLLFRRILFYFGKWVKRFQTAETDSRLFIETEKDFVLVSVAE